MIEVVILAAGMGTRLREYTEKRPKVMTPFLGRPILHWQQDCLKNLGLSDHLSVVAGYCSEVFENEDIQTVHNPDFERTNMVYSLFQAPHVFKSGRDVLILYGDIIYDTAAIRNVLDMPGRMVVAVNSRWRPLWEARFEDPLEDAETLVLDDKRIIEIGQKPTGFERIQGQFMGIIKIRSDLAAELWSTWGEDSYANPNMSPVANLYMTDFIQNLIDEGEPVVAATIDGGWLEIDSVEDLELYERLAVQGKLADLTGLPITIPHQPLLP